MEPAKDFGSFSILTAPSLIAGGGKADTSTKRSSFLDEFKENNKSTSNHITEKYSDEYSAGDISSNKIYSTTISKQVHTHFMSCFICHEFFIQTKRWKSCLLVASKLAEKAKNVFRIVPCTILGWRRQERFQRGQLCDKQRLRKQNAQALHWHQWTLRIKQQVDLRQDRNAGKETQPAHSKRPIGKNQLGKLCILLLFLGIRSNNQKVR